MIDESWVGEDHVEYCIALTASRFGYFYSTEDLHDIAAISFRLYADGREEDI